MSHRTLIAVLVVLIVSAVSVTFIDMQSSPSGAFLSLGSNKISQGSNPIKQPSCIKICQPDQIKCIQSRYAMGFQRTRCESTKPMPAPSISMMPSRSCIVNQWASLPGFYMDYASCMNPK